MKRDPTIRLAERVAAEFAKRGEPCAVIGAWAMAAHGYERTTSDLDLGVAVEFSVLRELRDKFDVDPAVQEVALTEGDTHDDLGGTLRLRAMDTDLVDVVNFANSNNALGSQVTMIARAALASTKLLAGTQLRIVDVHHLVALKLTRWSGTRGCPTLDDIRQLLAKCPNIHPPTIEAICEANGWGKQWRRMLSFLN